MRLFHFVLFCVLFSLTACGNKGPLRPLEVPRPETVQAPELRQQGDALLLGWQLPNSNQDGSLAAAAPTVDIYRMTYDPADDCPECFDRSTLLASIDPELPAPAQRVGNRYLLQDRPLKPGIGYQYKLVSRNATGEQSRPLILRQTYFTPVPAPRQLAATPRDSSLLLEWLAPALTATDQLLGYLVYRRLQPTEHFTLLNIAPLPKPRFEDFGIENGRRYHYRVRALVKRDSQSIESLPSAEVSAVPQAEI